VPPDPIPHRIRDLIREAAEIARLAPADWLSELDAATMNAQNMAALAEDPELRQAVRRATLSNLMRWVEANVENPGEPVGANLSDEVLQSSRNFVRRGVEQGAIDSYRGGQNAAWTRWMQIVFTLTTDAEDLRQVLDITSRSIAEFVDSTIAGIAEQMRRERDDLVGGNHVERRAIVARLIDGAPIEQPSAERTLGYRLHHSHTALIIWSEVANPDPEELDAAAQLFARRWGARDQLKVIASAGTVWVWVDAEPVGALDASRFSTSVRVAVGSSRPGIEGFRRSHIEALATQRVLARLGNGAQSAKFEDIQLVSLVTNDSARADEFVIETLGELLTESRDVQETLRVFLREQSSVNRTAEKLHAHRNTVLRRLARAQEKLPRRLDDASLDVAVALDVLHWRS
jgi:DNA-binding PucR family transcriptional regulator